MKKFWYPTLALSISAIIYFATKVPDTKKNIPEEPTKTNLDESTPLAPTPVPTQPQTRPTEATLTVAPQKKGNRVFYGELPKGVKSVKELTMVNSPSSQWRNRLETHLKRTGGEQLRELDVEPQESYIIMDGNEARNVERVIVTVIAKDGRMTRFFAEVDSESGYVTKSWGATIHESKRGN